MKRTERDHLTYKLEELLSDIVIGEERNGMICRELTDYTPHEMVFENADGIEETCSPTGYEGLEKGKPNHPMNWWIEYVDSLGGLHYGR